MSGLEAFGAIAGACQLIEASLRIMAALRHVHKLVNGDPNLFQQQLDQINQLMYTAKLIKTSGILQNGGIDGLLDAVIGEAMHLQRILDDIISNAPRRTAMLYMRAVINSNRESRIRKAFLTLEEKKSTLTLCALSTCSKHILQIRDEISEQLPLIRQSISDVESSFQRNPEIISEIRKVQKQLLQCRCGAGSDISASESEGTTCGSSEYISNPIETDEPKSRDLVKVPANHDLGEFDFTSFGPQYTVPHTEPAPISSTVQGVGIANSQAGPRYYEVCASESARQINGDIGCGNAFSDPNLYYGRIVATGNSRQVNGAIYDPSFAMAFFAT